MKTTLNNLRKHAPCSFDLKKLLTNLGKSEPDDEPLCISTILESNGVEEAIWCLRSVEGHDREIRLFAVECARSVQHLMTDERSIKALDVSENFANGLANERDLKAARDDAYAAAYAAAGAAYAADAAYAVDAAVYAAYAADAAPRDFQANLLLLVINGCFDKEKNT
jgi:hypothetical protein